MCASKGVEGGAGAKGRRGEGVSSCVAKFEGFQVGRKKESCSRFCVLTRSVRVLLLCSAIPAVPGTLRYSMYCLYPYRVLYSTVPG